MYTTGNNWLKFIDRTHACQCGVVDFEEMAEETYYWAFRRFLQREQEG